MALEELENIPHLSRFPKILEDASAGRLVIFIGAGVSRIIGCPSWKEFANKYLEYLRENKFIDYVSYERLKNIEARKLLSMCNLILNKGLETMEPKPEPPDFKSMLNANDDSKRKRYPIYEAIYDFNASYITTNFDEELDNIVEKKETQLRTPELPAETPINKEQQKNKIYYSKDDLLPSNLNLGSVIHLHGSVKDIKSLIITTRSYLDHYQIDTEPTELLKYIFSEKTVLFVGYGLDEFEILEHLIHKQATKEKAIQHYMLFPIFRSDFTNLYEFQKMYFNDLGIELVPYPIDENGHEHLYAVIDTWAKQIGPCSKPSGYYDNVRMIDEVLKMPSSNILSAKQKSVLNLFKKDKAYEDYFFNKVSDIFWFYHLKENAYFSPQRAPKPVKDDKTGYFHIPQWNVLPYLERVSEQVDKPENEQYIAELLDIISSVTEYHKNNDKALDNYITWSYFVKILLNIPNDKIPAHVIEFIRVWLDSEFDMLIPGEDIEAKLLLKFLNSDNQSDLDKAEKLVDIITDIKWQEMNKTKSELLRRDVEAKTVIDTYWLQESFRENAKKIGEKCGSAVIFTLSDKLKEILREDSRPWVDVIIDKHNYRIIAKQTADDEYNITVYKIDENDLKADAEEDIVSRLNAKLTEIYGFDLSGVTNGDEFASKIKSEFAATTDLKNITSEIDEMLRYLFSDLSKDYSYIWYKSLFSSPSLNDTEQTLTKILRDILLAKAKTTEEATNEILKALISNKYRYPLFRRLFLFIIGSRWSAYSNLFWDALKTELGEEFFEEQHYWAELYNLLQKNIDQFTVEEKAIIKDIIANGPKRYLSGENEDAKAYWKQVWYSALKKDPEFKILYEEQKQITKTQENLDFLTGPKVVSGPGRSPLTKAEILSRPNADLADYLNNFEGKRLFEGDTAAALAEFLKAAVKENPGKFIEGLDPFMSVGYLYAYQIIAGAKEAWQEGSLIEWGELLGFVKSYINRNEFWNDELIVRGDHLWKSDHRWVTGAIGELIQAGVKHDEKAFDASFFPLAEEILFLTLEKQEAKDKSEINDYVSHALNTSTGKVIAALIFMTLHIARLESKEYPEKEIKWSEDIKQMFNGLLDRRIVESFTLLGQYLHNFYYLDKQWVEEKISDISKDDTELWEAFMSGYLSAGKVYNALYSLMQTHYENALDYKFKEKETGKRLAQHIAVGYLRGHESLDAESLFGRLVGKWQSDQINDLIGFFWMQRDYLTSDLDGGDKLKMEGRERVIDFWRRTYENHFRGKSVENISDEEKTILSNLATLGIFLQQLDDENSEWLKLSARYINKSFNFRYLIKYLVNLKNAGDADSAGRFIGKILLAALRETFPVYTATPEEERIKAIVEFLYKSDNKRAADKICLKYDERGQEFLRGLYTENQN